MLEPIKIWNARTLIVAVVFAILGVISFIWNFSTLTFIFVSLLGIIVCLIACLCVKQVKNESSVVGKPLVVQQLDFTEVKYDTKGVFADDFIKCLEYLEDWKKENAFDFLKKETALVVSTKDEGFKDFEVTKIQNYIGRKMNHKRTEDFFIYEYIGMFKYLQKEIKEKDSSYINDYYMIGNKRFDSLHLGPIEDIKNYLDKTCHLWILHGTDVLKIEILEEV